MTTPNDLPTAQQALGLAFEIVRSPCSAAETQRAEILLGIAREIREEQQYRSTRNMLKLTLDPSAGERAAAGYARGGVVRDAAAVRYAAGEGDIAATQVVPALAEQTQRIPILWRVGDKADCRNCHTPIILCPRRMKDPLAEGEAGVPALWIHTYTDQRACAEPTMSSDDDEPTRAFAEPSIG